MKTKIAQITVITMLLLSIVTVPLFAQPVNNVDQKHPFLRGIPNLTEDQQVKIEKIHLKMAKEIMPIQNQIREKKAHLKTISTVDKPDMAKINVLIEEIGKLKTDLMKTRHGAKQEVRLLLNEEQRIHFDMMKSNRGKGNGKGNMHRGGQGHGANKGMMGKGNGGCF